MIVLDASVLIAHLNGADAHHVRASSLLLDHVGEDLAASTITLAEVLVGPSRLGRVDDALAALRLLGVGELALPADSAAGLAAWRAGSGLKLPDCCVLLAARHHSAAVATFDARLAAEAARSGLRALPAADQS